MKLPMVSIKDYIDTKYREYSIYTNNARAIPSIVDGFKPVQRKAIYTAIKNAKTDFMKVSALGGVILAQAAYHHGDAPAQEAIIKLAQDFNNNIPYFDQDGTFGTRLSPTSGAARYIYVKLSERFFDIFRDNNILPHSLDLDDHPEPLYYLPVIPNVLLNGVTGIAIGFATEIFPRHPKDLANACIKHLQGSSIPEVPPYQVGFNGTFTKDGDGYKCSGIIKYKSQTKVIVEELPIGISHEKYQEHLIKLREKGIIVSFVDNSDSVYNFEITLPRNNKLTNDQLEKELKIHKSIKENIVVVDDFKKSENTEYDKIAIRQYESAADVIRDFVNFRLGYYQKRIDHNIVENNLNISERESKIRFIKEVLSKKIKIGELTRTDLVAHLKANKYPEEHIDKVISMAMYNMTKDNILKLENEVNALKADLTMWENADAKALYIADLKEIAKKYK